MVGSADAPSGTTYAFIWDSNTPGASLAQLPDLSPDSAFSGANAINNNDVIVGSSNGLLVEWPTPTSAPTPLPLPANDSGSFALAINDSGAIVGAVNDANGVQLPVAWVSGSPILLQMPDGSTGCEPGSINAQGEIVGGCGFSSAPYSEGFYWASPDATATPMLLSPLVAGLSGGASAINNLGHSVGISAVSAIQGHATMWLTPTSAPLDLGPALPPSQSCSDCGIANAVNNLDQAVGYSINDGPTLFESGAVIGLPMPSDCSGGGWGFGINDVGQAVGGMTYCGLSVLWDNIGPPPTPQEQVTAISAQIQGLVSSHVLNAGNGNTLQASLNAASASITKGNDKATCNHLQAFVNKVQATVQSGRLTQTQGQSLLNASNPLITRFCH